MKTGSTLRYILLTMVLATSLMRPVIAQDRLVLGIHPYKTSDKLIKAYTPLAEYLTRKVGLPVHIIISPDYQQHIDTIGRDQFDIAYMGPAAYVKLFDNYGEKPLLARQAVHGKPTFQGKIIVPRDSSIREIRQLKGKRFAFGDPNSTMSHLVPRYMMLSAGVTTNNLKSFQFLGSHDNVALAVLTGDFDAGAVKEAVFYKHEARGLRAIATTPALSEHLFITSSRLDPALVTRLRQAMLTVNLDPDGKVILTSIKSGVTAMVPVVNSDYDNLREILRLLRNSGVIK